MNLLENRVAIVTGAGRGIGSSIARKFGEHGAKVVVHYNSSAKPAEELASKINSIAIQADLTNPTDCQRLVDQTMSEYGKIDILVNCASSFAGGKTIVEDTWESYQEEIKGVLGTTFHLIKCVAPLMIAAKYGRIINFGATLLFRPTEGYGAHITAKAAVLGMTRSLSRELGPHGITVNIVHPGMTLTEFTNSLPESDRQKVAERTPLRHLAAPDDIANTVLFLASDLASFVSNASLAVDGGLATI